MKRILAQTKRLATVAAAICLFSSFASAISVTPDGGVALITALIAPGTGLSITSLTITGHSTFSTNGLAYSWGTYTNASGTYSIGSGILISSGDVAHYGDGPNTDTGKTTSYGDTANPGQDAILTAISGDKDYFDVTEIDIVFDLDAAHDSVFFNVTFGSDEWEEYVGSTFIDAFGLLVNGTNIAFAGGFPINIDHPEMAGLPGTELDGVLAPGGVSVMTFSKLVGAGTTGNTLKFIIADSGDTALDSTAYISALGGEAPPPPPGIPEPASIVVLGPLALALVHFNRRRQG